MRDQLDLNEKEQNNFQEIINACTNNNQNTMYNKIIDQIIIELNSYIKNVHFKKGIKKRKEEVKEFSFLIIAKSINNINNKKIYTISKYKI